MDKKSLEQMIGEALGGTAKVISMGPLPAGEKEDVTILPSAQVEELMAYAEEYRAGCAFKHGDIVTPKKNSGVKGTGLPHVVLEVLEEPVRLWGHDEPSQTGSALFGRRVDIRVVCYVDNDHVAAFWSESYQYEYWR